MFGWMGNLCRSGAHAAAIALLAISVAAGHFLVGVGNAEAGNGVVYITSTKNMSIKLARGKPRTIKTDLPFHEIVIGDPEIANVKPLTDRSFYLLGSNLGTTGIALFDENKKLVGTMDIEVTLDTDRLASTIRDSVPGANIKVSSANGRLVLSGSAEDALAVDKATGSPPIFRAKKRSSTRSISPRRSRFS